ncbi:MAG: prevent-host-death protein [Alphaproteobacteria bacterium RIFOXYD12_FULL_60_8]|nr:MAG: prevent-host-death protein [Alphaproteobacteria bacterium RIFOXYD12_FULL_60_8]
MSQFNIAHAKSHFSELVDKALMGEEVVISRDNKPLLKLVPVKSKTQRQPGSGKSDVQFMASDFDAPLEDFDEYKG